VDLVVLLARPPCTFRLCRFALSDESEERARRGEANGRLRTATVTRRKETEKPVALAGG
jgi:hypothetical protein